MASVLLLLLLPALALARIEVEVSGKYEDDQSNMAVYFSGNEVGIISDMEMESFGLSGSRLQDAVRAYFGKRPSDAYVRSPTPWGDLYQSYGWTQVLRSLVPKSGRIVKITSEPQIVMQQIFENNSSRPATFNVGISQDVENTVASSWTKGGELSIGQEIEVGFNIEVMGIGATTSFSVAASWGESTEKSQSVTVGASSAMELLLQPGQSVLAQLQATKGSIRIEMDYEANLSGSVAVNYDETYKGHHFWGLDVQGVMAAANLSNKIASRQIIDIGFYSNAKVMVHDRSMGYKMVEVAF